MSERGVFVYVIRSPDGHVKVGTAKNIGKRLRDLQCANPGVLTVEYCSGGMLRIIAGQVEFEAHHRLRQHHVHGEWFLCSVEDARTAISEALVYVRNKRNLHRTSTKTCLNLRKAPPNGRWLS